MSGGVCGKPLPGEEDAEQPMFFCNQPTGHDGGCSMRLVGDGGIDGSDGSEIERLRKLENQVNWFDSSTHSGDWNEADLVPVKGDPAAAHWLFREDTVSVKPDAVCRICGHTPDWHYAATHYNTKKLHDENERLEIEAVRLEGELAKLRARIAELVPDWEPLSCINCNALRARCELHKNTRIPGGSKSK